MSAIDRQNRLLVAEDWQKIYRSFRNADFQSYDFENLRRTMIDYIRQNYPEDFNDYIESSEYLALIDLIAFLGQSIAFRCDLNARENFLELAERRESVLRLARMVSYNAKRNIAANGLLKFSTVQTTQTIFDSNGRNLANQIISWNDPSNSNWYDQFMTVVNASLPSSQQFGNPSDRASIYGIPTEQYRFQSSTTAIPIYGFSKTVSGRMMNFEITSTSFAGKDVIYEEAPHIGNRIACVYRDDGRGYGSANSGFFFNFVQGTLTTGTFTVTHPSNSESIDIASQNINNSDIWLYKLDQNDLETDLWTQVSSFEGNNIIYNSLNKKIRSIYGVTTKAGDSVSLTFSDGTFGDKPMGKFRVYYRISNGLTYSINSKDIRNISIAIPYLSSTNHAETLTITMSLASTVSNATAAETNDSIKANAPANYYTQNRMVTGEDYNISPLAVNQQVLKVKAINRSASGISRYFDLVDPTGKYSSTNLFSDDGILYKEEFNNSTKFKYLNKTEIEGIVHNTINSLIKKVQVRDYYYSTFSNYVTASLNIGWYSKTADFNSSTGYIGNTGTDQIYAVGQYTTTDLKYIKQGALIRFSAPSGKNFDTTNMNKLVNSNIVGTGHVSYIWAEVANVTDDGRASGLGVLDNGSGPILLNVVIPTGAIITQIIPPWRTVISSNVISSMVELIFANKPFGLRYIAETQNWGIIFEQNLDIKSPFSLGNQGDLSSKQKDASWLLLFTTDNEYYTVTDRELRYIFESDKQLRFYYDINNRVYDSRTNSLIKDSVKVLGINTQAPDYLTAFNHDLVWEIADAYIGLDGYIDSKKVVVTFSDSDNNSVVDNPELFSTIVSPDSFTTDTYKRYIVQERYSISYGQDEYRYISNKSNDVVVILPTEPLGIGQYVDGTYFYFEDTGLVSKLSRASSTLFVPTLDYKVYVGRDTIKFQYVHNADHGSRIDPGVSNLIDVYVLTKQYDIGVRQWVDGAISDYPLPPSTDELYNNLAPTLNVIKTMSDEIVYHPVKYKILFGTQSTPELQATFKVTKTPGVVLSDNDIKSRVITAINQFFVLENWDFGDTFYFSELSTYVMNKLSPSIASMVIVPVKAGLHFGSLFEIKSANNEIFISGATVNDIEIISGITASNIKSISGTDSTSNVLQQSITSSTYGSI